MTKVLRKKGEKLTNEQITVILDHRSLTNEFRVINGLVHAVCTDRLVSLKLNKSEE